MWGMFPWATAKLYRIWLFIDSVLAALPRNGIDRVYVGNLIETNVKYK